MKHSGGEGLNLWFQASRWQRLFLSVGHGLALMTVWLSALPMPAPLLLSAVLFVSIGFGWRKGRRPPLRQLHYDGETWTLVSPGHQVREGRLLGSTWCSRWLTLLHFRLSGGRFRAVPVWRDSLTDEDYRRLQVVLHWQADVS
ncbi:MAG: hypothetical protein Kow0060_03600 [Methylohalobius crimeensis]|uniref:protein YgfX n=1 Tax=Methylohalobius crimeensis TaxID=244365 RepID=UPI0003B60AAE|nr:protein YgfX [Methylohalobius crimeensis]